jgi:hypothetical protein
MRDWCSHGHHDGPCGYRYTETVRDDVGIFAPPTGIVRDILVGVCQCQGDHD